MVTIDTFKKLAMAFEDATEEPHFEKTSFRIKKKIFATLDEQAKLVCVKLSAVNQSVFSAHDPSVIYPVPNKWGKSGYTYIDLKKVRKDVLADALRHSYCEVAPKKLADKYRQD